MSFISSLNIIDQINTHIHVCVWFPYSVQHDIASKGGHASTGKFEAGSERAREAGRKGGRVSSGGGSMQDDEADDDDHTQDNRTE